MDFEFIIFYLISAATKRRGKRKGEAWSKEKGSKGQVMKEWWVDSHDSGDWNGSANQCTITKAYFLHYQQTSIQKVARNTLFVSFPAEKKTWINRHKSRWTILIAKVFNWTQHCALAPFLAILSIHTSQRRPTDLQYFQMQEHTLRKLELIFKSPWCVWHSTFSYMIESVVEVWFFQAWRGSACVLRQCLTELHRSWYKILS